MDKKNAPAAKAESSIESKKLVSNIPTPSRAPPPKLAIFGSRSHDEPNSNTLLHSPTKFTSLDSSKASQIPLKQGNVEPLQVSNINPPVFIKNPSSADTNSPKSARESSPAAKTPTSAYSSPPSARIAPPKLSISIRDVDDDIEPIKPAHVETSRSVHLDTPCKYN
jgi:hypothetical protein